MDDELCLTAELDVGAVVEFEVGGAGGEGNGSCGVVVAGEAGAGADEQFAGCVDDNGIGLGLGLRFAAREAIELNAGIDYVDYSDGGDDTSFGGGLLYNFNDTFSVGVEVVQH